MKVRLEDLAVHYRGVIPESETEEEKRVLNDIWEGKARTVCWQRLGDGNIVVVIAPTPADAP
mgnify:CR=1 FL=1